jgi:AcrR family transcriptional regulator
VGRDNGAVKAQPTETSPKSPGSRARQAAETRARVLDAAKDTFQEKGYLASSVADIVKRAGVAHGTFYTYFKSREDVLREIAEEVEERLDAAGEIVRDRNSAIPAEQRLRQGLREFLEAYRRDAQIMKLVEETVRYDEHLGAARKERLRKHIDNLGASIASLQRHGRADPDLDPILTSAIFGAITGRFPEMWLVDRVVDCSLDDAAEALTVFFTKVLDLKDS